MNKRKKLTIEEVKSLAEEKGGICLSDQYLNMNVPLVWKCHNPLHPSWEMPTNNLIKGCWCPQCRIEKYIFPLKTRISEQKGEWVSGEYKNSYTKITLKCENNHTWDVRPAAIMLNHWCPRCAHDRKLSKSSKDLHRIVKLKKGVITSYDNDGSTGMVHINCQYGHAFKTTQSKISQGSWCPKCAVISRRSDFEEIKQIVHARGGECLSEEYKGAHYKLEFQCKNKHIWSAKPNSVKNGTWCPTCNIPLGENIVKILLEEIFERPFPKSYPKWLKSEEGTQLELDGYNKELKIAFEHQGVQHLRPKGIYATGFIRRHELDAIKRILCAKHEVKLIEIIQAGEKRSLDEIKNDLINECSRQSISLPNNVASIDFNRDCAYLTGTHHILDNIKTIALSKGGRCISNNYGGHYFKLEFECEKKHRWFTDPATIKRGRWCPICAKQKKPTKKAKYSLEDMTALAIEKGGRCLSESFKNVTTHLLWECKNGHQWQAVPASVIKGTWCKSCPATKRNLNRYDKKCG